MIINTVKKCEKVRNEKGVQVGKSQKIESKNKVLFDVF